MKYLIIYAHPNPKSFCSGILSTVENELKSGGQEVVTRELYKLNFNPVLGAEDFIGLKNGKPAKDVKIEHEYIVWADCLIYIYPLWWLSMPAIFKGYIDRVHSLGFAYNYGNAGPVPLLKKKALVFTTQGGIVLDYEKTGLYAAMKISVDDSVFGFCGIKVLEHKYFSAVPYVDESKRKEYLEEVKQVVRSYR